MAMTKAERAEVEALRVRCALAWPPAPPKPVDLKAALAESGSEWLHLFWMNPASGNIGRGVTDGHMHATADYSDAQLNGRHSSGLRLAMSQQAGGPWFESEADAYRALHYALAVQCAEKLRNIEMRAAAAWAP